MSPAEMNIKTFKEFHSLVPVIVEDINRNTELSLRALANPLLAIEELGYHLTDEVKKSVERYLRFTREDRRQLNDLEQDMAKIAGRPFDPDSDKELETLLFKELKLSRPKSFSVSMLTDVGARASEVVMQKEFQWTDPIETFKGKHKVIAPLLAYRKIKNRRPPFVSRELYDQLKSGKRRLPVSGIKITFRKGLEHHEEIDNA